MKRRNNQIFKWSYLIFLTVLVAFVIAASVFVNGMLKEYENAQPEYTVERVMSQLLSESADSEAFWSKYSMPDVVASQYESNFDIKAKYLSQFSDGDLNYTARNFGYGEDELCYQIRDGKTVLAEVVLKAESPVKTKLAVFSWRDWGVKSITPIFEKHDYEIALPEEFSFSVNGNTISAESGILENGKIKYTLEGIYFEPEFEILDGNGQKANFAINNYKVNTEYYDYTLTLPHTLSVCINGENSKGEILANGNIRHDIMLLEKPEVVISDLYGNSVVYEGKELPLTYMTVTAPSNYNVLVDGNKVAESAIKVTDIPDYDIISALLENVPKQCEYNIAILKDNCAVTYSTSENGDDITLDNQTHKHDLMEAVKPLDSVPQEVSDKVDVLSVAQSWSLFMSNDFSFANLEKLMLKDSYQYEVAKKYNTSIDKTLFSNHSLLDPAFTDNKVCNFVWITEDSFSVEVSFVKHMRLVTNQYVDDAMNDRFYFVYSDGSWLLAGMKEVAENE